MNELKSHIKSMLSNECAENLYNLINEYEEKYPYDFDLYGMKIDYYLFIGDLDKALSLTNEGLRVNPCNAYMYYKLAIISEELSDFKSAYENYTKASELFRRFDNQLLAEQSINSLERISMKLEELSLITTDKNKLNQLLDICKYINKYEDSSFELFSEPFKQNSNLIDTIYNDGIGTNFFIANYNHWIFLCMQESNSNFNSDLITRKGEFVSIYDSSGIYEFNEDCDILLPIYCTNNNMIRSIFKFYTEYIQYNVPMFPKHFNYYRLPGKVKVEAPTDVKTIIGKPILLKQDTSKKKLVLNIFVDGLPQVFINSSDFNRYMPYTKDFFSKGIICNNAYANSEWTYPSIATIFTGLKASHHMMIHPKMNISLPTDTKLISEYFQEKGYYTAKIGGNWRITPNYGYLRGFDRVIYQHRCHGLNYDETIVDTIEHLKMSNETNQFLWIEIGDLHDIADEFDLPSSVQAKASILDIAGVAGGTTSVKQIYNKHKINLFKLLAERVDYALATLYNYISQNYNDNDIVISLFSDHGQGFMVKKDEHFFSPARSNIALMIRSSFKQGTICNEYISTTDYIEIMGKLADLEIASTIDSNLPKYFGGTKNRPYVFSECLHATDLYKAAMHSKEHCFYINTEDTINYDGRFNLANYKTTLLDKEKNEIHDKDIEAYYISELKNQIAHLQLY